MLKNLAKNATKTVSSPVDLVQDLITFLAADEDRLMRFLALSGVGPGELRHNMGDPGFLGFILDFALQDEELIIAFAAHQNMPPEAILRVRAKLPGANLDF